MTSYTSLHLNLHDVNVDATDRLKKSQIASFSKQWCSTSRLPKYSIPSITIQFNVKSKQPIQISAKTCPSKYCCHGNIRPHNQNSTTSSNCQINLRKNPMIWKDYLKLSEIANYSKLARHQKPPPSPPRQNRVKGWL